MSRTENGNEDDVGSGVAAAGIAGAATTGCLDGWGLLSDEDEVGSAECVTEAGGAPMGMEAGLCAADHDVDALAVAATKTLGVFVGLPQQRLTTLAALMVVHGNA